MALDTLPGARRLFMPLRTAGGILGVVGLDAERPGPLLTPEQRRLFDALSDQAAVAIERVNLVADVETALRAAEADRLRQALLTSISHDLRTPLAAIVGSAGTLRDFAADLTEASRAELAGTILDEGERLNRFIANLLDMTKLRPAPSRRTTPRTTSARSSAARWSAPAASSRAIAPRSTSPPTCRWSRSIRC